LIGNRGNRLAASDLLIFPPAQTSRTTFVTEADGTSTTNYSYGANTVQVTDPVGKWKNFTVDAFGNLTSVREPDPLNQPGGTLTTTYAYDILNHLTTVTMPRATGTQTRTFNYTTGTTVGTLLLSATNPENGTVSYTYNTDKTLATKTDALNQQFSYTYDSYKRVTQINVGQTVIRQFYYDTNPLDSSFSQNIAGRLAAVQNGVTTNGDTFFEMYSYTQPGEVTKKRLRLSRSVQSHTVTGDVDAQYSYDNEGKMTSVTYPQSSYIDQNLQVQQSPVTTYTYGFDTMGRLTSMTGPGVDNWGNPASVNIVNGVQYGPASEMLQMSYFGATETRQYNTRLQMTRLTVPAQINISYNFASQNNGQIASQTNNLSGEQIAYQYDALQRLSSASTSAWSQTFTYDGFGNLTDKIGTGGAPTNHSPVNAGTNQLTGYTYDANGNLITTGFGWDPENRMSYANTGGVQYAYDSANKRIWTGNYTCPGGICGPGNGWQFQSETVYFYGIDGKRLASYTPHVQYSYGTPQSIYYVLGEERVYFRKYIGNANTSMMSGGTAVGQDRLGSTGKYFPYGEERNSPLLPNDTVKFATYTRDSATGLDYADRRYFANGSGRFLSPDPYRASSGPSDPQSWNRYTYVGNDPINRFDPTGMDYEIPEGGTFDPTDPRNVNGSGSSTGGTVVYSNNANSANPAASGMGDASTQQMFIYFGGSQRGGSGSPGSWLTTFSDLAMAASLISDDYNMMDSNPDCAQDLQAITGPDGQHPTLSDLQKAASNAQFTNPATSSTYVETPLTPGLVSPVMAPVNWIFDNYSIPGPYFLHAMVPTLGSNQIYWRAGDTLGMSRSDIAGAVMHELLHTMGYSDKQIQTGLFGTTSVQTVNISDRLAKDCF
jgi:RHS repeat-associated protein